MRNKTKFVKWLIFLLLAGLLLDLTLPLKKDFRKFDPEEIGHLDQIMWRAYYEKKPVTLFMQLARLMRSQFGAPFFRSYVLAYYSAKAAFIFKDGRRRDDYNKALLPLSIYYKKLNTLSNRSFDFQSLAQQELEWWIIRRDRTAHPPSEWVTILAHECEIMYGISAEKFNDFAVKRVEAMIYRDEKGDQITEADWEQIDTMCKQAWTSLYRALL